MLDRVQTQGAIAPQFWPLEVVNGLLMAERRNRIAAGHRVDLLSFVAELPVELDDETTVRAWAATARLAEQHRLSAYDASYLERATRLDLPLATADRRLATAARSPGTLVLPVA